MYIYVNVYIYIYIFEVLHITVFDFAAKLVDMKTASMFEIDAIDPDATPSVVNVSVSVISAQRYADGRTVLPRHAQNCIVLYLINCILTNSKQSLAVNWGLLCY